MLIKRIDRDGNVEEPPVSKSFERLHYSGEFWMILWRCATWLRSRVIVPLLVAVGWLMAFFTDNAHWGTWVTGYFIFSQLAERIAFGRAWYALIELLSAIKEDDDNFGSGMLYRLASGGYQHNSQEEYEEAVETCETHKKYIDGLIEGLEAWQHKHVPKALKKRKWLKRRVVNLLWQMRSAQHRSYNGPLTDSFDEFMERFARATPDRLREDLELSEWGFLRLHHTFLSMAKTCSQGATISWSKLLEVHNQEMDQLAEVGRTSLASALRDPKELIKWVDQMLGRDWIEVVFVDEEECRYEDASFSWTERGLQECEKLRLRRERENKKQAANQEYDEAVRALPFIMPKNLR